MHLTAADAGERAFEDMIGLPFVSRLPPPPEAPIPPKIPDGEPGTWSRGETERSLASYRRYDAALADYATSYMAYLGELAAYYRAIGDTSFTFVHATPEGPASEWTRGEMAGFSSLCRLHLLSEEDYLRLYGTRPLDPLPPGVDVESLARCFGPRDTTLVRLYKQALRGPHGDVAAEEE